MHYYIYADTDTTLYEATSSMNASLDEILEVRKDGNADYSMTNISRTLIKFDHIELQNLINTAGLDTSKIKFYLNLYDAGSENLRVEQELKGYPLNQSWDPGTGYFNNNPITSDGASWIWKDNTDSRTQWSEISQSGATWYSGSGYEASQSFGYETQDVRMDVTDIVLKWTNNTIDNNGFILKRSGSIGNTDTNTPEGNNKRYGNLKWFSRETHTVWQPKLEMAWDDSTWSVDNLQPITGSDLEDMVVYQKGVRPEYKEKSKAKFRLVGRPRYPKKTFSTTSDYLKVMTLPSGSTYYQIKDAHTEDVIIPFDEYSKVSCDKNGNYFNLWLNGLQAERFYKFEFKVVSGSGTSNETVQFFDGEEFKINR